MRRMKQVEIELTNDQRNKVERIFGGLRWIWNYYLTDCINKYKSGIKIIDTPYTFDAKLNNKEFRKEYPWLKHVPSKARVKILNDCNRTLKDFFAYQKDKSKPKVFFPHFKDKWRHQVRSFFFIKNQIILKTKRYLQIPIIGNIFLKERGYLSHKDMKYVTSGRLYKDPCGRYFVNLVFDYPENFRKNRVLYGGIGIDLGIRNLITTYGKLTWMFPNVNNINRKVFKYTNKINKLQRAMKRKAIFHMKAAGRSYFIREDFMSKNIRKIINKLHKYYYRLRCIRNDYIKQIVNRLTVKLCPAFITIEDIHIEEMCSKHRKHPISRKSRRSIINAKWFYIRQKLQSKCEELSIELRLADRWYQSSQICSECGYEHTKLGSKIKFKCPKCGYKDDRDYNAARNLYKLKEYEVIA